MNLSAWSRYAVIRHATGWSLCKRPDTVRSPGVNVGKKHCRISSEPKLEGQLALAGGNDLLPVFLKVVDAIGCGIL